MANRIAHRARDSAVFCARQLARVTGAEDPTTGIWPNSIGLPRSLRASMPISTFSRVSLNGVVAQHLVAKTGSRFTLLETP